MTRHGLLAGILFLGCGMVFAQEQNPTTTQQWPQNGQGPQGETANGEPIYKINVVSRDIPAINYFHRSGSSKVGFRGTSLAPDIKGDAEVSSLNGRTLIKAHFQCIQPTSNCGV